MTPDPIHCSSSRLLATSGCALHAGQARNNNVLGDLKEQFNNDRGVPRLVVLVSPDVHRRASAARSGSRIRCCKPNANLKIQVYAVWFSMLPTDSPEALPGRAGADARPARQALLGQPPRGWCAVQELGALHR